MLSVASKEIRHDLFAEFTRGLGARRITKGSFVSAQSHLYPGAVCSGVLRRREEELLELLDAYQDNICVEFNYQRQNIIKRANTSLENTRLQTPHQSSSTFHPSPHSHPNLHFQRPPPSHQRTQSPTNTTPSHPTHHPIQKHRTGKVKPLADPA